MRRLPWRYSEQMTSGTRRPSAGNREFPAPGSFSGSPVRGPGDDMNPLANPDLERVRVARDRRPRTDLSIGGGGSAPGRRAAAAAVALLSSLFPADAEVTVFAAASLTAAAGEVFENQARAEVSLSFAASSVLGAPDRRRRPRRPVPVGKTAPGWISSSIAAASIRRPGSTCSPTAWRSSHRRVPASTSRSPGSSISPAASPAVSPSATPITSRPGCTRGRRWSGLGWWSRLEPRLAPAPDVRGALVFVERGACSAGIVYATDAAASGRVEVAAEIPDSLHEPILYPAAAVAGRDSPQVRAAMARLLSPAAARIFRGHGFTVLPGPRVTSGPGQP